MKLSSLVILTVFAIFIFSFKSVSKNSNPYFDENYEDIGTVKYSILKLDQFRKTQKGIWVLLDGRELDPNSELKKLLQEGHDLNILKNSNRLPDARGRFIRSMNDDGVGSDPDKQRLVGSIQADALKAHQHGFGGVFTNSGGTDVWKYFGTVNVADPENPWKGKGATNGDTRYSTKLSLTSLVGDPVETRPENITMYTYLKVAK